MNPKKIIYSILKEILKGESIPNISDYEITSEQFVEIIIVMKNEEYLNPKRVSFYIMENIHIEKSLDIVTSKGWNFLEEKNFWSKLYKGLKEIRSFLP